MLIRTQDKDNLINFNTSIAIGIVPPHRCGNNDPRYVITIPFNPEDSLVLGFYSEHEQCIEILDEIQTCCTGKDADRIVYIMPQDE